MNIEDTLAEIYRMIEGGDVTEESNLESISLDFQDDLFYLNRGIARRTYDEFIGPPEHAYLMTESGIIDELQYGDWDPFTRDELDAIRHYYGQKMALESEGTIVGLAVPMAHELFGQYGLKSSPHRRESLYDIYVNTVAAKDYYLDEGLPGMPFSKMLSSGKITDDEFIHWGEKALERLSMERF
tara:strand:+ start:352 stop:903 length:552 start_codon:yes stop_codon:yes gene_type:complete